MACQAFRGVSRGSCGDEQTRIGQGILIKSCSAYLIPGWVDSELFFYSSATCVFVFSYYHYCIYLLPQCGYAVLCRVFCFVQLCRGSIDY